LVDGKRRIAASGHGVLDGGRGARGRAATLLECGPAGVTSAAGIGHAVRRHELTLEERLDPAR